MKLYHRKGILYNLQKGISYKGLSNIPENLYFETSKEYNLEIIPTIFEKPKTQTEALLLHPLVEKFIFDRGGLNPLDYGVLSCELLTQNIDLKRIQTTDLYIEETDVNVLFIDYTQTNRSNMVKFFDRSIITAVELFHIHTQLKLPVQNRLELPNYTKTPAFPLDLYRYN